MQQLEEEIAKYPAHVQSAADDVLAELEGSRTPPPAKEKAPLSYGTDVRKMQWYSKYRHTVFSFIGSQADKGAKLITIVGISGDPSVNSCTTAEWPAIQEDLAAAFKEKKSPFDAMDLPYDQISPMRIPIDRLAKVLKQQSSDDDYVIVASCPDEHFEPAKQIIREHNQNCKRENLNQVDVAWATRNDVYS